MAIRCKLGVVDRVSASSLCVLQAIVGWFVRLSPAKETRRSRIRVVGVNWLILPVSYACLKD